jgi:hypothetical protein
MTHATIYDYLLRNENLSSVFIFYILHGKVNCFGLREARVKPYLFLFP